MSTMSQTLTCTRCQLNHSAMRWICPHCGHDRRKAMKSCSTCTKEVPKDASHCSECGEPQATELDVNLPLPMPSPVPQPEALAHSAPPATLKLAPRVVSTQPRWLRAAALSGILLVAGTLGLGVGRYSERPPPTPEPQPPIASPPPSAVSHSLVLLGTAEPRGAAPRFRALGFFVGSDGLIVTSHEGWLGTEKHGLAAVANELGDGVLHCLIDAPESGLAVLRMLQSPESQRTPVPIEFSTEVSLAGPARVIAWNPDERSFRAWPVTLSSSLRLERTFELPMTALRPTPLDGAPLLGAERNQLRGALRLSNGVAQVVSVDTIQQLLLRARRASASVCGTITSHPPSPDSSTKS